MIQNVYVYENGMVMVFDEKGHQMPAYQGRWEQMKAAIERDKPSHVIVRKNVQWTGC
jgi:hypothetical protein